MPAKRVSAEQQREIYERYLRGERLTHISAALGLTRKTVRGSVRRHGLPKREPTFLRALSPEQEAEVCRKYRGGATARGLARELGVTDNTVCRALYRHGIAIRTHRLNGDQRKDICRRYQAGEPMSSIAYAFDVHTTTVSNVLRRSDISIRSLRMLTEDQEREACKRYGDGEPVQRIAQSFGVCWGTVDRSLRRHGVAVRPRSRFAYWPGTVSQEKADEMCRLYKQGVSVLLLGRQFGISVNLVRALLAHYGAPVRRNCAPPEGEVPSAGMLMPDGPYRRKRTKTIRREVAAFRAVGISEISAAEAARVLRVHHQSVREWLHTGHMTGRRDAAEWRVNLTDIEDFMMRAPVVWRRKQIEHLSGNECDLIYAAGFIDGEGSITAAPYNHAKDARPALLISNTNLDVLVYLQTVLGGLIYPQRLDPKWKTVFILKIANEHLLRVLAALHPWLRIKSAHAEIVLGAWRDGLCSHIEAKGKLHALNKRGLVVSQDGQHPLILDERQAEPLRSKAPSPGNDVLVNPPR